MICKHDGVEGPCEFCEIQSLRQKLAESVAREAVLVEALHKIAEGTGTTSWTDQLIAKDALKKITTNAEAKTKI